MNEECSYIITLEISNPHKTPMKIVSAEIPTINNKKLAPRSSMVINIQVPPGYRDYIKPFKGLKGMPCLMVGWVEQEAGEEGY